MKKKKWIIAAVIGLIILVVPFYSQAYKDGGTRTYTALTYKIVDFNKLLGDGEIYDETKFYPFPLNFMSDDFLMASANGVSVSDIEGSDGETAYEAISEEIKDAPAEENGRDEDIPATPPELKITYDDEKSISVNAGTYCWFIDDGSEEPTGICCDALYPLESRKYMKEFTASSEKIKAVFPIEPDSVIVRCWPESAWGKTDTAPEEIKAVNGEFSLKKGKYIYLVTGVWESGKLKGSDVSYSFCAALN